MSTSEQESLTVKFERAIAAALARSANEIGSYYEAETVARLAEAWVKLRNQGLA